MNGQTHDIGFLDIRQQSDDLLSVVGRKSGVGEGFKLFIADLSHNRGRVHDEQVERQPSFTILRHAMHQETHVCPHARIIDDREHAGFLMQRSFAGKLQIGLVRFGKDAQEGGDVDLVSSLDRRSLKADQADISIMQVCIFGKINSRQLVVAAIQGDQLSVLAEIQVGELIVAATQRRQRRVRTHVQTSELIAIAFKFK